MKHFLLLLGIFAAINVSAQAAVADETFVHPGGAYQITIPAGWHRLAALDGSGAPYQMFSPDPGQDINQMACGLWAMAEPIPTDEDLAKDDAAALAQRVLLVQDPGLTVKQGTAAGKLGALEAALFEIQGKRPTGAWRGQMLVAVWEDTFIVVRYGCDPQRWDQMSPVFARITADFVAPAKRVGLDRPLPLNPQEARDVAEQLAPSVPLIHIMAYLKPSAADRAAARAAGVDGVEKKELGWGSGFVVRSDGYVITNRHVVSAESDGKFSRSPYDPVEITWDQSVHLPRVRADVVAVSRRYDMALLKIADSTRKWPAVPLADLSRVRNADRVLVMGWPDPGELGDTDVNHNEGSLAAIEHDKRGRVVRLRHSARTTAGNSGGPLYDLNTGAVIGIHFQGIFSHAHDMTELLYHGTVPIDQVLWEFPQILLPAQPAAGSARDRLNLIAYYFWQQRFGAAVVECRAALAENPQDGLVNAYLYRIFTMQGASDQAAACLEIARNHPESRLRAELFAGRGALECDDVKGAQAAAQEAVRLAPGLGEANLILGEAELGLGQYEASTRDLARAQQLLKGTSSEAEACLGWLPVQQWLVNNQVNKMPWSTVLPRDIADAANGHLNASYKLWSSRNWAALGDLGLVAGFSGDLDGAAKSIVKAVNSSGGDPDAMLQAAYFQCLVGNADAAVQFAQESMQAQPTPRAHFILAWGLLLAADATNKAGKSADAQKLLKVAVIHEVLAAQGAPDAFWAPTALQIANQFKSVLQQ